MHSSHPQIEAFFINLATAINNEDLNQLEKLYLPDAEWFPPGHSILHGWANIKEAYANRFTHFTFDLQFKLQEVSVSDDFAFVTGTIDGTFTSKAYGDEVPNSEKFMAVVVNSDSGWRLKRLIWNQSPKYWADPIENKATGIGGIFFKSTNPEQLRAWYTQHLGLVTNQYGALFEFRQGAAPEKKGYLQWSPFSQDTTYFAPSEKEFMINYRVQNMEQLVERLKKNGVTICDEIATYEYGKFVHILDLENNKIELWEPIDNAFTEIYEGKTTL